MADPLACTECRAWWSERREEILGLLDMHVAVDALMRDAITALGIGHLRRSNVNRREVLEGVVGRFHSDGHRLLPAESYDDDEVAAVR